MNKELLHFMLKKMAKKSFHSEEVAFLLKDKGALSKEIREVLERLTTLGFMDDKDWEARYVQRCVQRGCSYLEIYNKLTIKGLKSCTISRIQEMLQSRERESLLNYAKKKRGKELKKLKNTLFRKGFSLEVIEDVID